MSDRDNNTSNSNESENNWVFSPKTQAREELEDEQTSVRNTKELQTSNIIDNLDIKLLDNEENSSSELSHRFDVNPPTKVSSIKLRFELAIDNSKDWIITQLVLERDQGNFINIAPIFLGLGIWIYFTIAFEPILSVLIATLIVAILAIYKFKSRGALFHSTVITALVLAGMTAAQWQVKRAQMEVPSTQITSKIQGLVLSVDKNTRGSPRYLIRPTYIEKLQGHKLPKRIRLSTLKKYKKFRPGDTISGLTRLSPLSGPAYPGGYDFAFFAWFKGHAMSGFFMGEPNKSDLPIITSKLEKINIVIANLRASVGQRVRAGIKGEPGDLAVALITGDRSGLSRKTQESLRKSGLAHILAISGLHMALVTLTMVWLVRSVLLLIPELSNKYPIKKWAIGIGFLIATFYLFLSGNAIATQRAWIMISIMMLASLLDRPAITIRSVAVAAFIILLLFPASLFSPGFQMSFAAVVALVSIYRIWTKYQQNKMNIRKDRGLILNTIGSTIRYGVGLSFTSLIAGTATAFFAAWHFHRIAPLGFIANLGAMPIVSVLVMPLALASVLLMPYGLESVTLVPLGLAIEAVVWVSEKTNSIPINFNTGIQPKSMLFASLTILGTALLPIGKLRYFSIVPIFIFIFITTQTIQIPHLLIAQDGRTIAAATNLINNDLSNKKNSQQQFNTKKGEGALTLLYPRRNKFVSQIWLKAYSGGIDGGKRNESLAPSKNRTKYCDKEQCKFLLGKTSVYIIYNPKLISNACEHADILAAPRLWYVRCKSRTPKIILKRQDFEKNGSHAIWLSAKGDDNDITNGDKEVIEIEIKTAWHPVKIAPTPTQYVEPNNNPNEDFISNQNSTRRPWLRRYEMQKSTYKKVTKNRKEKTIIQSSDSNSSSSN